MSRLLFHYWTADDDETARKAQIGDWIEDLVEFGPTVVNEACKDWRQTQTRRPTIADIRLRCIEVQNEARERGLRIEDHREPWPGWLRDIWGNDGQLQRREAIALNEAREIRGDFFRGKPPDAVAEVSFDRLQHQYGARYPSEVITRAFDLIAETMRRRSPKEAQP